MRQGEWNVKDETGNRYGRLVADRRYPSNGRGAIWVCKCDCGNEVAVPGVYLRTGKVKSCGCLRMMDFKERGRLGFWHGKARTEEREAAE